MSNQNLKVDHKTVIEEFKRKHNYLADAFDLETVHKMSAPTSTTLTDEQINAIKGGIFIEGTFLGKSNPVLLPYGEFTTTYRGYLISGNEMIGYSINKTTKVISLLSVGTGLMNISNINTFNGKTYPQYPENDVSKFYKCENGTLKWEDINLADIVDSQGNKRFVEGDIEIEEISGVSQTYGKWSLSGTHLMIVVGVDIADTTAISSGSILCFINVPDWVKDKISTLVGTYVDRKEQVYFDSLLGKQTMNVSLRKDDIYGLYISLGQLTFSANRSGRIQFDLLIDAEEPVSAGE